MAEKWHNYVKCGQCGKEIEIFGNFEKGDKLPIPRHKARKADKISCYGSNHVATVYSQLESK